MIKIKNKKLLFSLLGVATFALPIAAVSCSVTVRPDNDKDFSTITTPREDFAPSMTTATRSVPDTEKGGDAKKNVNVKIYRNFVAPSLFVESGTLISDKGVNESFYEGIKAAAAVYNEFYRIHKPAVNAVEYSPRAENKNPTYYTPTLNFLDNYETGYTERTKGATGANVLVTVGAKNSAAIKAWMWEAKNVDIPILNDKIAVENADKAKIDKTGKTADEVKKLEAPFDKKIKGFEDEIAKINNTIIVAYGFDPSASEKVKVFEYKKDPGQKIGYKNFENVDRVEKDYAIPAGQSIQIDPGSLTGRPLNDFIATSIYNVLLDLDTTKNTDWKVLNKGGAAKNETFVLGAKSIKIVA